MKKPILLLAIIFLCGCSRAFWMPDWDKAESEKVQYDEAVKQTKALERIANALERLKND